MGLEDLDQVERGLLEATQDGPLVFNQRMIEAMVAALETTTAGLVVARNSLRFAGYVEQEVNDSGHAVVTITPAGEALFE